mgnify:FL=1
MSSTKDSNPSDATRIPRRWIVVGTALVLLVAPMVIVGMALNTPTAVATPPAEDLPAVRSTGPSSAVSIELGRVICGDCCVGDIWKAIGSMPGVRDIDAKAGNSKFVLFYDRQVTDAEKVLAKLVASGEEDAKLAPVDPSDTLTERRWVRPARQQPAR